MAIERYACEEVFQRLDDYLDRELNADEMRLMREHLEICAQCAMEHRFERRVLDDVREKLQHISMPADLKARVAEAILRARADRGL